MSEHLHFSVRYDGPALSDHMMDVRTLSPALIALADLIGEANKVAYPDAPDVQLQVRGNFKAGSFGIDLAVAQTFAEQVVSLLTRKEADALNNLYSLLQMIGLLGGGGISVIALIKWLRGRKPTDIRQERDKIVFVCKDTELSETLEVDAFTGRIYQSRLVRQALVSTLKPLEREGVDFFAFGQDGVAEVVVTREELEFFTAVDEGEEIVADSLLENVLLQIESAVFKEGNKWRFTDGTTTFYAEVADAEFLVDVNSGERRFGKLDVLRVDMQCIQSITDNGLKTRHIVTRVHEHRGPIQRRLFGGSPEDLLI